MVKIMTTGEAPITYIIYMALDLKSIVDLIVFWFQKLIAMLKEDPYSGFTPNVPAFWGNLQA